MLPVLSERAAKHSLSGFEFACGIPGTLGGAVFMNAGAHGGAISDVLVSSRAYDVNTHSIVTLDRDEHEFAYRHSTYMENQNLICLSVSFALTPDNEERIRAKMQENMKKRRDTQPLDHPSAGSFFKRPEGHFAAKLIDDCGLKGLRVGGACVSEKHAGFIVNLGGATASDILTLSDMVSAKVKADTGVTLEREVIFVE
jgi:UDP-N-acetylmuramate dehydrogenase